MTSMNTTPPHASCPHEAGTLEDCPACEARCHCQPGQAECIYSGQHNRQRVPTMPLWLCQDCYVLLVNGDVSPDVEDPGKLLSLLAGDEITAGMLAEHHADGCPNHPEWSGADCDCEHDTFSWSPCAGCGSNLGGDRYAVTAWITE